MLPNPLPLCGRSMSSNTNKCERHIQALQSPASLVVAGPGYETNLTIWWQVSGFWISGPTHFLYYHLILTSGVFIMNTSYQHMLTTVINFLPSAHCLEWCQLVCEGFWWMHPSRSAQWRQETLHVRTKWDMYNIRESVDSLCRDGADAQHMQYF